MNILIAEDNQYTALQYDRVLKKCGHDVTITKDGQDCIEKYSEKAGKSEFESIEKNPFDVVVLDQSMPKMTGAQAAQEILDKKPSQRIIFASAYGLSGERNSEKFVEKVEFLQKPFSLTKLVRTITGQ
ncbi:hypothetical protein C6988_10835 [Nitrosopumilus sp. b1]|uniref:response regulator n=1 Tax=Nitrosopumilus sp. b1 TaxID=2109907 RepID=UPI0015F46DF1|nr:response regulator [Nitrosopumilus sp. b1]KAF6241940.1 hypothetical protein C6988_10835 [Nitrosopumilus sp. b1]